MEHDSFFISEGKKKKRVKYAVFRSGKRIVKYSKIDQWLKAIQLLIKDLDELSAAKKKAEEKMKRIKKKNNTESKEKEEKTKAEEKEKK